MKTIIPNILVLFYEFKANRLRPAIVKYLHNQKTYWDKTIEKFYNGDKFEDEKSILGKIHHIENELAFENSYQLLKLKYREDKRMLATVAAEYFTFWTCLDYFRLTHGLNAFDLSYANEAMQIGSRKMQIYKRFEELLNA